MLFNTILSSLISTTTDKFCFLVKIFDIFMMVTNTTAENHQVPVQFFNSIKPLELNVNYKPVKFEKSKGQLLLIHSCTNVNFMCNRHHGWGVMGTADFDNVIGKLKYWKMLFSRLCQQI